MHYVCCTGSNALSKALCFRMSTIFARENCTRFCIWFCVFLFLFFLSCNIFAFVFVILVLSWFIHLPVFFKILKINQPQYGKRTTRKNNKKKEWKTKEKLNNPRTVQWEKGQIAWHSEATWHFIYLIFMDRWSACAKDHKRIVCVCFGFYSTTTTTTITTMML